MLFYQIFFTSVLALFYLSTPVHLANEETDESEMDLPSISVLVPSTMPAAPVPGNTIILEPYAQPKSMKQAHVREYLLHQITSLAAQMTTSTSASLADDEAESLSEQDSVGGDAPPSPCRFKRRKRTMVPPNTPESLTKYRRIEPTAPSFSLHFISPQYAPLYASTGSGDEEDDEHSSTQN